MKQLFKQLLEKWTCKHKWGVHREISERVDMFSKYERITEVRQTLICSECGKIKRIFL